MAPSLPSPSGPIHWVLDWDGTITKRDTLDALVNIATECKPNEPISENWKRVTQAYLSDYEATLKNRTPRDKLPSTISEEKTLLKILEEVEQRSLDRVAESGIFKGVTAKQLEDGAATAIESGRVEMRQGCVEFLQHVHSRIEHPNDDADAISIVSVNWSQRFIAGCLKASHIDCEQTPLRSIFANELEGVSGNEPSSGRICAGRDLRILSSHDKLVCLKTLRRNSSRKGKPLPVVYVGDSWTDFECLIAADLGICIRDEPMTSTQKKLADSLIGVGIQCLHLREAQKADNWEVVWAHDFQEIKEWMEKMD
ncbi:hypothetical protein BU26DRAFT_130521 [Trematosphaeria pertusa]|uniref:HAD-like protein n=1 Tax=Trematosphaeria pertusa TaxID=390896 RepID=A0A6A6HZC1_9PLEO|nr:uncharacterized protein BU26DRAFT_130521 [Trematosphaeria pertusa]KAF2242690.1 hypothetical protein BU26DRAFT_130521 [Trematosphaeria pertusa]